jgi:hypothetical protein
MGSSAYDMSKRGKADAKKNGSSAFAGSPGKRSAAQSSVSYVTVPSDILAALLDAACAVGGAVLLAKTSDGHAFALTFFYQNEREKVYVPEDEDVTEILASWVTFFQDKVPKLPF